MKELYPVQSTEGTETLVNGPVPANHGMALHNLLASPGFGRPKDQLNTDLPTTWLAIWEAHRAPNQREACLRCSRLLASVNWSDEICRALEMSCTSSLRLIYHPIKPKPIEGIALSNPEDTGSYAFITMPKQTGHKEEEEESV